MDRNTSGGGGREMEVEEKKEEEEKEEEEKEEEYLGDEVLELMGQFLSLVSQLWYLHLYIYTAGATSNN